MQEIVNRPKVRLVAPYSNQGGWGRHSRCFRDALVQLIDVDQIDSESEFGRLQPGRLDSKLSEFKEPTIFISPPHRRPPCQRKSTIFYSVWEASILPRAYVENLRCAEQVWVPSEWGRSIFEVAGIPRGCIRVVPEGVDTLLFTPSTDPRRDDIFRFLYVGKWEERKGTVDLIRAFTQEFHRRDRVVLTMHFGCDEIHGRSIESLMRQELKLCGSDASNIQVSTRLSEQQLVHLMQSSDAFVLPTRAEGWGLPILEAMACGLPCIVTNYSAHLEFVNDANSYLIDVERFCPVSDTYFFPPTNDWGVWAQPNLSHLRALMRHVVENPAEAREKGVVGRSEARKWEWSRSAQVAVSHVDELLNPKMD